MRHSYPENEMNEKRGNRNRLVRDNSNGMNGGAPMNVHDERERETRGRLTTPERLQRETLAVVWDMGACAMHLWHEARRKVSPMSELMAPGNPFKAGGNVPVDYDDLMLARAFEAASRRMAGKRAEGRTGWETASIAGLEQSLRDAVSQQKWIDVVNYAAMLYERESK